MLLSDKLYRSQGLALQKAKTRLMPSSEFLAATQAETGHAADDADMKQRSWQLMRLSLRFDPYSPARGEDYERLKAEIQRINILPLLRSELTKARVHAPLAKRLVRAVSFLDQADQEHAVLSLLENAEVLFPVWASVLVDQI